MGIGLAVSLFQAVTSIHEQTLTFVPKVVGIGAALVILLPWMLQSMVQFTTSVIEKIPQMVH
jgi:flagellar biosynthetic protein FliQ